MVARLVVPYHKQNRDYTCGPACLRMVLEYWNFQQDEVSLSIYGDKKSNKKTRGVVKNYLIAYIGEKAVAGTPHYDKVRKIWSVPIRCYTPREIFFRWKN